MEHEIEISRERTGLGHREAAGLIRGAVRRALDAGVPGDIGFAGLPRVGGIARVDGGRTRAQPVVAAGGVNEPRILRVVADCAVLRRVAPEDAVEEGAVLHQVFGGIVGECAVVERRRRFEEPDLAAQGVEESAAVGSAAYRAVGR